MTDMTPWGVSVERKRELNGKQPVQFFYPWHNGWLGPIRVVNGTTEFELKRKQALDFQKSVKAQGRTIEIIKT